MMYLYVHEAYTGGKKRRKETEELILRTLDLYVLEEKLDPGMLSREILREEKGKPFFKEIPLEFSVSHTGDLWVCAMSPEPVGVDIQMFRKSSQEKIMDHYYTQDEMAYVEAVGPEGFFDIWARKEAYVKYLGTGLTKKLKEFSTLRAVDVNFVDFVLPSGIKGACCTKGKEELWIRKLP